MSMTWRPRKVLLGPASEKAPFSELGLGPVDTCYEVVLSNYHSLVVEFVSPPFCELILTIVLADVKGKTPCASVICS